MARNIVAEAIPDGWNYGLLDNFATRCSGHTPSKSYPNYWNGGIKWISLADSHRLDKGHVYATDKEISIEGINNSSAEIHPAGTVVLSRDAGIGKSGVMAEPMAVSQHFIAWKCDNESILHSWFLYNWLQFHKREFERQAVGSTIKTIGLPYFKKLKIALPPYREQKKIAEILSTWDKAITTAEQLLANSQQQKKALMQQLLTGKKRLLDENGVRFSGEWERYLLGEIVEIRTSTSKSAFVSESGHNFIIDMGSVSREGKLIPSKRTTLESDFLEIGQLVMPKDDIGGGNIIGRVGLITEAKKYVLADHVYALKVLKNDSDFISYLINTHKVNKSLRRRANGTAQLGLGKKDVQKQVLHIPVSIEEQQKIAAVLSTVDQESTALQRKVDTLKHEKKAFMQQLLTGKRRVKVDEVVA